MDLANDDARLRGFWHPVAQLDDLGDEPVRVVLLNEPLVVVRLGGEVRVLPDRCPHRSARLSDGLVIDGELQCPYHGWRFDPTGRCTLIPALGPAADLPPRAHVTPLRVRCAMGLVLVALDEPRAPLPAVPEWDDPAFRACWLPPVTAAIGAAPFVDNFLDLAHFPFVHTGTFGADEDALVHDYGVEPTGPGFTVRYEHLAENHEDPGVATGERPLLQPRRMTYTYTPPFAIRLRLELPVAGSAHTIVSWARPETAGTTVLHQVLLRGPGTPDDDEEAVRYELSVLAEDLRILEHLPGTGLPLELPAQVHTRADRATVAFRRHLATALDGGDGSGDASGSPGHESVPRTVSGRRS